MLSTQSIMVLNAVMENPGLDILELSYRIEEMYGKNNMAVRFMFLNETDENSHVISIIKCLYCVEKIDNHYFFNENISLTDEYDVIQNLIRGYLKDLKEKIIKKEIEEHGENIIKPKI